MRIDDLAPLQLVQIGDRTLLKMSTVYSTMCTAQVLLDQGRMPARTTVRTFTADEALAFEPATADLAAAYESARSGVDMTVTRFVLAVTHPASVTAEEVTDAINAALNEPPCAWGLWVVDRLVATDDAGLVVTTCGRCGGEARHLTGCREA